MIKLIDLGNGKCTAIDSDMEYLNKYKWFYSQGYAVRSDNDERSRIRIHREVLGINDSSISVDHINGDRLDNRRENLRVCSQKENTLNRMHGGKTKTSKYKGVHAKDNRWIAQISINKNKIYLGSFDSEEEAAEEYDRAAEIYHKQFASTNKKINNIKRLDYNKYEILKRAKTYKAKHTYEVHTSNGLHFNSITAAAEYFKVKPNTITKACTDKNLKRSVRGVFVFYGKKVEFLSLTNI